MNPPLPADLHIHTYYSDGTSSPDEVVAQALSAGLGCIAVTDHDVLDGIRPTQSAAAASGLEIVPGIELSSELDGRDIHLLGYFIDCGPGPLAERLSSIQR